VKDGLRTTISASLVPTLATGLRCMARVNLDHANTTSLRFVLNKGVQLGKAPTMQAPFVVALLTALLATPHRGGVPDVLEVLQDEGTARGGMLHNVLREDVIVVSASPKLFPAQLFEVSFGRASAFGLQFAFQTEDASFLFLPALFSQELPVGGNRRAIESQVYAYDGRSRGDGRLRKRDNDMQRIAAFAVAQVCTTWLIASVLLQVRRNGKAQLHAPVYGGKATSKRIPLDPRRTLVIAHTGQLTVRATNRLESRNGPAHLPGCLNALRVCLFLLDLPGERALDGFSGLDTCRTHHLCRQIGVLCSQGIVRALVQLHAIAACRGKALVGNGIEARRMLLKGCLEYPGLLWRWMQLHGHRSIHARGLS